VYKAVNPLIGKAVSRRIIGFRAGGDITRYIDVVAEKAVLDSVKRNKVNCTLISEEMGVKKLGNEQEVYLVVDAVDGTTNATRGLSFVSTSIAASEVNRFSGIESAVVMNLIDGGTYTAVKGEGSKFNGVRIAPSRRRDLSYAVVSVDLSKSPTSVDVVTPLLKEVGALRALGSAALEICHVASGKLDAYVDVRNKLRTTDIAAATLIIKEAGGLILQPDGEPLRDVNLTEVNRFSLVAAGNKRLFESIRRLLKSKECSKGR